MAGVDRFSGPRHCLLSAASSADGSPLTSRLRGHAPAADAAAGVVPTAVDDDATFAGDRKRFGRRPSSM